MTAAKGANDSHESEGGQGCAMQQHNRRTVAFVNVGDIATWDSQSVDVQTERLEIGDCQAGCRWLLHDHKIG
jgi:hypothetical protein